MVCERGSGGLCRRVCVEGLSVDIRIHRSMPNNDRGVERGVAEGVRGGERGAADGIWCVRGGVEWRVV